MALATWWRDDPVADAPPMSDFAVRLADADATLAQLTDLTQAEVENRRQAGHRPYARTRGRAAPMSARHARAGR